MNETLKTIFNAVIIMAIVIVVGGTLFFFAEAEEVARENEPLIGTNFQVKSWTSDPINPSATGCVASVTTATTTVYYDTFAEAWNAACDLTGEDVIFTLYGDWIAEEGRFGTGENFGPTGALFPKARDKKEISLTIDLNGYKLDRHLTAAVKSGEVLSFQRKGTYTVCNGLVTGGYNQTSGGGIWVNSKNLVLTLENATVQSNRSLCNGGGIYLNHCNGKGVLTLRDTTISNNYCSDYGGGLYMNARATGLAFIALGDKYAELNLEGKVVIADNSGRLGKTNLVLRDSYKGTALIHDFSGLTEGSRIIFSLSSGKYDAASESGTAGTAEYFRAEYGSASMEETSKGRYRLRIAE